MMRVKYFVYDTVADSVGYVDAEDESVVQNAAEDYPEYIYFFPEPLTIEDFLIDRVVDLEKLSAWWKKSISDPNPWLDLTQCIRIAIDWHKNWPVLVETPPEFEQVRCFDNDSDVFRLSQRLQWMTQQEYVRRFGSEPPTAPLLRKWATVFSWHPDFNEEWRS